MCVGCLLLLVHLDKAAALDVWIDTDVAIASPFRDPDDAFALALALRTHELRIVGISTTYGNASRSVTERSALEIMERFGATRDVTTTMLHLGALSPGDLGSPSPATNALAKALLKRRLVFLALGPLTNLASLLKLHPEVATRIDRVVFIGGRTGPGELKLKFIHVHDANTLKDPAAVEAVLRSKVPILVIPLDVAMRFGLNNGDIERLHESGSSGRFLAERSRPWSLFFTRFVGHDAPLSDALGVVALTRPDLISARPARAALSPDRRRLVFDGSANSGRPVSLCTSFHDETKATVLNTLQTNSP